MVVIDGNKICSACGNNWPVALFSLDISKKDGYNSQCKTCKAKMGKDYRDIRKVMNLWGESEGNVYIWKLDLRRVFVRCDRCNNDINIGHIVWTDIGNGFETICRNCILYIYRGDRNGLEEFIMGIDYQMTINERDGAYNMKELEKLTFKDIYGITKAEADNGDRLSNDYK